MTMRYLVTLLQEELDYFERLLESDQAEANLEMKTDLLLRLDGLAAIEEKTVEKVEVIPRAEKFSGLDWEFESLTLPEIDDEARKKRKEEGWMVDSIKEGTIVYKRRLPKKVGVK